MNFYASSVALLWATAMRLRNARTEVREADAAERMASSESLERTAADARPGRESQRSACAGGRGRRMFMA
jgi:hypothetical protein